MSAYHHLMGQGRLPDGFGVRVDPRVRRFSDGRVLIGGSPKQMLTLAPTAAAMIGDGFLEVTDSHSALVARKLLDSGVANPRPMSIPSPRDVTVVVPLENDAQGLARLLPALHGLNVIVVDDGSEQPVTAPPMTWQVGGVTVVRHESSRGPAAARNTGLRRATTDFVAFLDSDVVPRKGWLEVMLGHFSDPAVALVAPRIVSLEPEGKALARYEHARSSLDLGRREAAVRAGSPVSYVPSAAMLIRRQVALECNGFDESLQVAEDMDLCWRLQEAGWRLRYEPVAHVAHDHRVTFGRWVERKMSDGAGASPLADRHPGMVPPVSMSPWTLVACLLAASFTKLGVIGALATLAVSVGRLRAMFTGLDQPTRIAAILATEGFIGGLWQLASALCRHYWPITLLAVVVSGRIRKIAFGFAVAEAMSDWYTHRELGGLDPVRYAFFKRIDDVAYGTGLWMGAVETRSLNALTPRMDA